MLLSVASGLAAAEEPAEGLLPLEQRGKTIYIQGESPTGGEVTALMGQAAVEVPGASLPCVNCHGRDGKGKPEGGVTPTNLTWDALTKPYGVTHESGREHPPYTSRLLKRAIAMGIDPAGNPLHAAMPRYRMSLEDMEALVAYLQKLGADPDPGLSSDSLRLGTLLPPPGQSGAVGDLIASVLRAYFDEVNAQGGIYSRRVDLRLHHLAESPSARRSDVETFLREERIFALVGAFIAGVDAEIPALMAEHEVPLVGPFTLYPQSGFPLNRQVFYLLSGLPSQSRVLVDFAVERHPVDETTPTRARAAVIFPAHSEYEAAVEAVAKQAADAGWTDLERFGVAAGRFEADKLAKELSDKGVEVLYMLHPEGLSAGFLAAADRLGWHPEVYAPGALAGGSLFEAPATFENRLFLSFPTLPGDQTRQGIEHYRELAKKHELPGTSLAVQLSTLAAAEILVEGLKRAGRELSRDKLVEALENLYDYQTGLVPPVTYNPNRRIGALGAYVVAADLSQRRFHAVGEWREPE